MKKYSAAVTLWTTLVVLALVSLVPAGAGAATAPTNPASQGQALEIAPPVITLAVNPGQTAKATIYLRNISNGDLIVTGQANDFVAAGEDGTPKLLLKESGSNPYSLKDWVGALPSLRMVPKEIKTMTVPINVPANASPGGHYGAIRFTATPADIQSSGVSLSASLGALILLTVNGQVNESMSIQQFSAGQSGQAGTLFESGSLEFITRLKNTGNVHLQPVGQITVTNMFGKKVASVNVNLPPRNVLPQSTRKFESPLDKTVLGNKRLFGKYTADLVVTYGNNKKTTTASTTFWVIPYRLIAFLAIVLVAAFFLLRHLMRRYNRRIIAKSQQNQNQNHYRPPDDPRRPRF